MSFQQTDFDTLYFDQFGTQRLSYPLQSIRDRLQQPSIIISGLIILVTLIYHFQGPWVATAASSLVTRLWAILVQITPAHLLNTLENWLDPLQPMRDTTYNAHAAKSATMRRLLGLDRASGIMTSVFQARSRAISITGGALGLKSDPERPPGLGNRDNSCFQNSVLQGLAALQPFRDYLSACLQYPGLKDDGISVTYNLRTLLSNLNDASNNGRTLWTPTQLKKFMNTWSQQDAQEYYSKILDSIDQAATEALKASKEHSGFESDVGQADAMESEHSSDSGYQSWSGLSMLDTICLRNPLEGLLAQRVSCIQCGHSDGLHMIPFNCLTLTLSLDSRPHDLYERLDAYSAIESIEGVECQKCTLLKQHRLLSKFVERLREGRSAEEHLAEPLRRLEAAETALEEDRYDDDTIRNTLKISPQMTVNTTKTKQVIISRPPQSLVIHVNRSVFDASTFHTVKNSAPVNFPTTLDLGPWCLGSANSTGESGELEEIGTSGLSEEEWIQNPTMSMVAGDLRPSRLTGPIYELRSVVTHAGHHEDGHYICYRKHPRISSMRSQKFRDKSSASGPDGIGESKYDPMEADSIGGKDSEEMDWWRLSDHNVSKVDEGTISRLSQGVFMLFYDCVDPSMTLQDSPEQPGYLASEVVEGSCLEPASTGSRSDSAELSMGPDGGAQEVEAGEVPQVTR